MKFWIIAIFALILTLGCSDQKETQESLIPSRAKLEGKWKLISILQEPNTIAQKAADSVYYYKLITAKTFTWVIYHKATGRLQGTAGGTYTLDGEKYTEDIEYIYPHDPSMMSANIPFLCQLDGDRWTHSGYIEDREYDSLLNDFVVLSKYKLEEVWERIE